MCAPLALRVKNLVMHESFFSPYSRNDKANRSRPMLDLTLVEFNNITVGGKKLTLNYPYAQTQFQIYIHPASYGALK